MPTAATRAETIPVGPFTFSISGTNASYGTVCFHRPRDYQRTNQEQRQEACATLAALCKDYCVEYVDNIVVVEIYRRIPAVAFRSRIESFGQH